MSDDTITITIPRALAERCAKKGAIIDCGDVIAACRAALEAERRYTVVVRGLTRDQARCLASKHVWHEVKGRPLDIGDAAYAMVYDAARETLSAIDAGTYTDPAALHGDALEEYRRVVAERDRYREALRQISRSKKLGMSYAARVLAGAPA